MSTIRRSLPDGWLDLSFLQKGCGLQELPLVPQKLVFIDFFRDLGTGFNDSLGHATKALLTIRSIKWESSLISNYATWHSGPSRDCLYRAHKNSGLSKSSWHAITWLYWTIGSLTIPCQLYPSFSKGSLWLATPGLTIYHHNVRLARSDSTLSSLVIHELRREAIHPRTSFSPFWEWPRELQHQMQK